MYICLAPMDGITDAVYRYVVYDIVRPYLTDNHFLAWTEFMSSDGYIHSRQKLTKHLITFPILYSHTIAQIYG